MFSKKRFSFPFKHVLCWDMVNIQERHISADPFNLLFKEETRDQFMLFPTTKEIACSWILLLCTRCSDVPSAKIWTVVHKATWFFASIGGFLIMTANVFVTVTIHICLAPTVKSALTEFFCWSCHGFISSWKHQQGKISCWTSCLPPPFFLSQNRNPSWEFLTTTSFHRSLWTRCCFEFQR